MDWITGGIRASRPSADADATILTTGDGNHCTRGHWPDEPDGTARGVYVSGAHTLIQDRMSYFMPGPDWTPAWITGNGKRTTPCHRLRFLSMKQGAFFSRLRSLVAGRMVTLTEQRVVSWTQRGLHIQRITVRVPAGTNVQYPVSPEFTSVTSMRPLTKDNSGRLGYPLTVDRAHRPTGILPLTNSDHRDRHRAPQR